MKKTLSKLTLAFALAITSTASQVQAQEQIPELVGSLEPVAVKQHTKLPEMVSFNKILKDGEVNIAASISSALHQSISLGNDDATTRAYKAIFKACEENLDKNKTVQALFAKPKWNKKDRQSWQRELAQTISIEVDKVPGFDEYRTMVDLKIPGIKKAPVRSTWFNHLADDLIARSHLTEFDCKHNTLLEGCLIQNMENKKLKEFTVESNKHSQDYYYAAGRFYQTSVPSSIGYHVFIMCPTGDPIESTVDPSKTNQHSFLASTNDHFNLQKFEEGLPVAVTSHGIVFIYGKHLNPNIVQAVLSEESQVKATALANH